MNKSIVLLLSMLLFTSIAHSNPSFDCSLASTNVENFICETSNADLQELDKTLSNTYKYALKKANSKSLKINQRKWLKVRDTLCSPPKDIYSSNVYTHDIYLIRECLKFVYESRINELSNNLVAITILYSELPYKINLTNKLVGELTFSINSSTKNNEVGLVDITQSIYIETKKKKHLIWSVVSEKRDNDIGGENINFNWLKIYLYKNKHILLEVNFSESNDAGNSGSINDLSASTYITYSESMEFHKQGSMYQGKSGYYNSTTTKKWISKNNLELHIASLNKKYDDYSYINRMDRSAYIIQFKNSGWLNKTIDVKNHVETESYFKLYDNFNSNYKSGYVGKNKSCIYNNIDWVKVAKSLDYWLSFALYAQKNGISYNEALFVLPKLLIYKDQYPLTDTQVALAVGLNYYRKIIESTPQWKEKLNHSISDPETFNNGFPNINNQCAKKIPIGQYSYLYFDNWLYTFWARRYKDGSYNVAKLIINHIAKNTSHDAK